MNPRAASTVSRTNAGDFTDAQMLKAMANENAEDDRTTIVRDTLLVAQKFLIEHPEACKSIPALGAAIKRGQPHEHGSSACISHFLSEKNWSERTIREYLGIAEDVADHVASDSSGGKASHAGIESRCWFESQVDTVKLARDHLKEHAEDCKLANRFPGNRNSQRGRKHEHGSRDCISAFLGKENWSPVTVSRLLRLGNPEILSPKVFSELGKRKTDCFTRRLWDIPKIGPRIAPP